MRHAATPQAFDNVAAGFAGAARDEYVGSGDHAQFSPALNAAMKDCALPKVSIATSGFQKSR